MRFRTGRLAEGVRANSLQDRVAYPVIEEAASDSREFQISRRRKLNKGRAAVWIQVLLRVEPELSLTRVATELALSDRQLGRGLGLLIREGKARIRQGPGGPRVERVEAIRRGEQSMFGRPCRGTMAMQQRFSDGDR